MRFEGEIVAGVAALTEEIATEAARLIEVEYEPLPVVTDFVAAMEPGATLIHPDLESYDKDENIVSNGNTMAYHTIVKGDADAAMATADVVVKGRYVSDASQGVPIEPRAVVAQWQGDKVTIWSSTQVPYAARAGVAQTLAIPESDVRVVVPLLGGGFGAKCDLHFEAQVAALARAARRPVRLVFSREEEFKVIAQRREGIAMEFETGVTPRRTPRRATGEPGARQGRVLGRGRVPRADGRDACLRPVPDRQHRGRGASELHEQPALGVGARADGAADVLGPRAAHGRGSRRHRTWTPSSFAAAR